MTQADIPVIDLSAAPGRRQAWSRPSWQVYLWSVCEVLILRNPLQPSSPLRAATLRVFGAKVGRDVVLRPGLRVKFPWNLAVGDRTWVGEDVWLHNQAELSIGSDAVISQGTFVTTGTHLARQNMALATRPVVIEDGVWITARCTVLAGVTIKRSALVLPATVVDRDVEGGTMFGSERACSVGQRFSPPKDPA